MLSNFFHTDDLIQLCDNSMKKSRVTLGQRAFSMKVLRVEDQLVTESVIAVWSPDSKRSKDSKRKLWQGTLRIGT